MSWTSCVTCASYVSQYYDAALSDNIIFVIFLVCGFIDKTQWTEYYSTETPLTDLHCKLAAYCLWWVAEHPLLVAWKIQIVPTQSFSYKLFTIAMGEKPLWFVYAFKYSGIDKIHELLQFTQKHQVIPCEFCLHMLWCSCLRHKPLYTTQTRTPSVFLSLHQV